jgi:hypothetical protein
LARYPVATATNPNNPLTVIVDTQGRPKCVTIQNVSAVDCYYSELPDQLQNTLPGNVPPVGHHLPPDATPPTIVVIPRMNGKLYARAQGAGGQIEAIQYELCSDAELRSLGVEK